ncbi:hypothetical protein B0H13DRAFT_2380962 [Mycena leptocephala]|nr:hypothetical protein B0H13DRAFT_2380962 [Mycena leptocephala]
MPDDPGHAHSKFSFINPEFVPAGQVNGQQYEGGKPDTVTSVVPPSQQLETMTVPNGLQITIHAWPALMTHGLREVWAYLWENWYWSSHWELWVSSAHLMIPVLKTTMMLESHWQQIKHDFLHDFHLSHCDWLAWILIVKLVSSYYCKLDQLLTDTGRYRELPCWHKDFKRLWQRLKKAPIMLNGSLSIYY